MTTTGSGDPRERWRSEAEFFDRWAAAASDALRPTEPATLERYRTRRRPYFSMEFRYGLMGDLQDKRVLDAGCGDGVHSVIFALFGAQVTGIDVSSGSIVVASRRAEIDGVADRATFVCAPIESAVLEDHSFDIVWVYALLHHVIPDLELLSTKLRRALRPGGLIVIAEPVNLSPWLRRLRLAVAGASEHTPGERPLEARELAILRRVFPELEVRYFRGLARLDRYLLPGNQYEGAALWRRALVASLCIVDYALLSIPLFQPMAGGAVMSARIGAA